MPKIPKLGALFNMGGKGKPVKQIDIPNKDDMLPNPIFLDSFKDTGLYKSVQKMYADNSGMDINKLTSSQESQLETTVLDALDPQSQSFVDTDMFEDLTDSEIKNMVQELVTKFKMPKGKAEFILDEMGADVYGRARAGEPIEPMGETMVDPKDVDG